MTAPTPTEQATLDRFEAAEPAPESLTECVARAMHAELYAADGITWDEAWWATKKRYRLMADAAIATMRGQA